MEELLEFDGSVSFDASVGLDQNASVNMDQNASVSMDQNASVGMDQNASVGMDQNASVGIDAATIEILPDAQPKQVFQCGVCFKEFTTKGGTRRHMKIHDPTHALEAPKNNYKHPCQICKQLFPTPSAVERHMSVHTGEKRFQCENCGRKFSQKDHHKRHLARKYCFKIKKTPKRKQRKRYKCSYHGCKRDFSARSFLNRHFKQHIQQTNFLCDKCGQVFLKEIKRKYHMVSDHGVVDESVTEFKCEVCDKSFFSQSVFKLHKLTHSTDNDTDDRLVCQVCGKIFPTLSSIRVHAQGICGKNAFKYKCRIENCQRCFFQEETLKKHMKAHDNGRFKCDTCQAVFSERDNLRRHLILFGHTATGILTVSRQYKCKACDNIFFSLTDFKEHKLTHSTDVDDERLVCQICGKIFLTHSSIRHHARRICGKNTFKYRCHIENCRKFFSQEETLKKHMKAHDDGLHKCDTCQAVFNQHSLLRRHLIRLRHTATAGKSRQYKCKACNKIFFSQIGFKEHKLTHSTDNDDSLVCQVCGVIFFARYSIRLHARGICGKNAFKYRCHIENCQRFFSREETLKKHMKAHNDGLNKCDTCQAVFNQRADLRRHLTRLGHTATGVLAVKQGQYDYECTVCLKKCSTPAGLERHSSSHSKMFNDACRQCGQEFFIKLDLMNHIKELHAMAYVCHICGERFKKYEEVGTHMTAKHDSD
jgi:KRAB domain-containing zinc finger protein